MFIGSDRRDVSREAAVAAPVDLLVEEASGVQAHSLLPLLQQGGLHPLDLQDLGLYVWGRTKQARAHSVKYMFTTVFVQGNDQSPK